MPAITSITVNDRESTPVAHTYDPAGPSSNGTFEWQEFDGVPMGNGKFTLSVRKNANGIFKCRMRLEHPVVVTETINGVDRLELERVATADTTFSFSDDSTLQERKNLVGVFANMLAESVTFIDDVVTGLKSPY